MRRPTSSQSTSSRYEGFSWTGTSNVLDLMCVAKENGGLYIKANDEDDLVEALEKTLDCPMTSQAPSLPQAALPIGRP